MRGAYRIYPLGDQALTIELAEQMDEEVNLHCHSIAALLRAARLPGVLDVIPAYTSISLIYDAVAIHELCRSVAASVYISDKAEAVLNSYDWNSLLPGRQVEVPACFDLSLAPDLADMSAQLNLPVEEIVRIYLSKTYRVYMIGFLPGFAYMGKVDEAIAVGRKERPHLQIAAGSIGIAGLQTGIYPLASPGGWNIIGCTPLRLFNPEAEENPCLIRSGDEVLFHQVSIDRFHQLNQ